MYLYDCYHLLIADIMPGVRLAHICLVLCLQTVTAQFFWVLTDLHYDPTYHTLQKSCNFPIPADDLGRLGHYECDPPWELVEDVVTTMRSRHSSPDFIIWMGDTAPHYLNDTIHEAEIISMLQNTTNLLQNDFPNIPIYPAIGNHDYHPVNQLPPRTSSIYSALSDMWSSWLGAEAAASFRTAGYYTKPMPELTFGSVKMRIIVVNSNLYNEANRMTEGQDDPAEQFTWLEEQLNLAKQNNEKVHMVAHIPPGVLELPGSPMWFREDYNIRFNQILRDHADVITAVHSGHQHHDSFRIIYDNTGVPVVPLFLSPSVTPWKARIPGGTYGASHNPGVRRHTYTRNQPDVLIDYDQWHLKLDAVDDDPPMNWRRLYSFRAAYGTFNTTAQSLHQVKEDFKSFSSESFHLYYDFNSVGARDDSYVPCGCTCKFRHICAIEHIDRADFKQCFIAMPCGGNMLSSTYLVPFVLAFILSLIC